MVTYSMTAIGIPLVIGGGVRVIGRDICEHMNYRVFLTARLAVLKLLVFQLCLLFTRHLKKKAA